MTKKSKQKPTMASLTQEEKEYFRSLHGLIDQIFEEAQEQHDWTWSQLATNANLAYTTVCNLGNRDTRFPMFRTIFKLAKSIGWEVSLVEVKSKQKFKIKKRAA